MGVDRIGKWGLWQRKEPGIGRGTRLVLTRSGWRKVTEGAGKKVVSGGIR